MATRWFGSETRRFGQGAGFFFSPRSQRLDFGSRSKPGGPRRSGREMGKMTGRRVRPGAQNTAVFELGASPPSPWLLYS